MNGRLASLWGLNVPLEGTNVQGAHRRKKSDAGAGRNEFVSFMVDTWSGTEPCIVWKRAVIDYSSGGQPGRTHPYADYKGPVMSDLAALFKKKDGSFLQRF
ncbi:hypothetical protein PHMEG_00029008 [Phytophthora megakarya]|uniref:Uncharacterized protein n=1 Tax=Phytophthora megakarya TaxID=4795 RepID=A0A225V668_9STRA|nr:hypothetical protein PHMEG_00029008 [Phytophthora megakarya]